MLMVKERNVKAAMNESFCGKLIQCPKEYDNLLGMKLKCQYGNGRLHMSSGHFGFSVGVEKHYQVGKTIHFMAQENHPHTDSHFAFELHA